VLVRKPQQEPEQGAVGEVSFFHIDRCLSTR
jgi:hypothetical protein